MNENVLSKLRRRREQNRRQDTIEYGQIIQRFDAPEPDDLERLDVLMTSLSISENECALHIEGVIACRRIREGIEQLKQEEVLHAQITERAQKAAVEVGAAGEWWNRGERDAANNKALDLSSDQRNFPKRISNKRGELVVKMRSLPLVYSMADIAAA